MIDALWYLAFIHKTCEEVEVRGHLSEHLLVQILCFTTIFLHLDEYALSFYLFCIHYRRSPFVQEALEIPYLVEAQVI